MTLATKQFEWTLEGVILLIVVIVACFGGYKVWTWYDGNKVNGATVVEQAGTAKSTSQIQTEVGKALEDSGKDTTAVDTAKAGYERKKRDIVATDQGVATWGNGVVPVKLRNAARESREARDRSADFETGRTRADGRTPPDG